MIFCVPSTCRGLGALLKAFLPLLLSVLASTSGTTSRDALSEYGAARHHLVMLEGRLAVGAALERALSAQEKVADGILRTAKRQALSPSQPDAGPPIASQHFFDAKPRIEKTLLFSLLREMPKGAVLHTHPDALPDVKWVIQHATYDSRLWVCGDVGTGQLDNPLSFQFSDQPHGPSEPWNAVAAQTRNNCAWRQVTALRNASGDESAFDQALLEDLTLLTSRRPAYRSQEDVWTKFQHCFGRISGIYYFTEYHRALMEAAFRAIRDDGVQHLEMRQTIRSRVYDLDGKLHPIDTTLENLASAANSAGISLRVQLAEMRSASSTVVAAALENASRLMTKYPGLIVGFDLVGQEDAGRPLADFLPELLQVNGNTSVFAGHAEMRKKMPFFFHAGETDQAGLPPDANLFDAVLLNSTRIGHGYSLSQHPVLRQLVAAQVRCLKGLKPT